MQKWKIFVWKPSVPFLVVQKALTSTSHKKLWKSAVFYKNCGRAHSVSIQGHHISRLIWLKSHVSRRLIFTKKFLFNYFLWICSFKILSRLRRFSPNPSICNAWRKRRRLKLIKMISIYVLCFGWNSHSDFYFMFISFGNFSRLFY